jgi:SanA protein
MAWFRWAVAAALAGLAFVATVNVWMVQAAATRMFADVSAVPRRNVGLLLGTDRLRPDGTTNRHFEARVAAAARLLLAGKVDRLLVSGHPDNRGCNEPREMAEALVRLGVPRGQLDLDELGERTWESVRSAHGPWQLTECTVITDRFHAARALFLCRRIGLEAVAYCPPPESDAGWAWRTGPREWLARIRALADFE